MACPTHNLDLDAGAQPPADTAMAVFSGMVSPYARTMPSSPVSIAAGAIGRVLRGPLASSARAAAEIRMRRNRTAPHRPVNVPHIPDPTDHAGAGCGTCAIGTT
jgi:hypothetical protein